MSQNETILQFGGGNFLRAFVDLFIQELNESGDPAGRVVVVQSTASRRAEQINAQNGRYHVVLRGLSQGRPIDEVHPVESLSRALVASGDWSGVLDVARSDELELVVSNTTEAGYQLEETDADDGSPPKSFPAKLALVLRERYRASSRGITVLPCELVDYNGVRLRDLVLEQAGRWELEPGFREWLEIEVVWLTTLVDRIVSGRPETHPLLAKDALLTVAEPYAFWAVEEGGEDLRLFEHPAIQRVSDVSPFSLRKVRILNGAHTALVGKALPMGIETVREAVEHREIRVWLEQLLSEEIVPVVTNRMDDAEGFAATTLERFANPFLEHKLEDIALHHETKVLHRLKPTAEEYGEKFGREPRLLGELLKG